MDKKFNLLTINEFAEILKVHPNTVRNGIKSGRIQAFRAGGGKKSAFRIFDTELNRMAEFDAEHMIENIIENRKKRNNDF